ncbi:MAG: riboflavin synthase [Nitrospirae bacterium]|jgi:riboflavin synthase|nr:riboflavin synthase [Nitrospirota bacterium]
MFTGIILEMGQITSLKKRRGGAVLSLKTPTIADTARIGDSISVNGVCLTVISINNNELSFDLSDETLSATNLGSLKTGDRVNLEPSLTPDSRIGGHFVTGHVDSTGKIKTKENLGDMIKFEIQAAPDVLKYLVRKGSIAVDGISLTVVDILKESFTLIIIPHTAKVTTLGFKVPGDSVNIETDILGKYVAKFLNRETADNKKDAGLMKTLLKEGYI